MSENIELIVKKQINKRLHTIDTFHAFENDVTISGKDELGNDFTINFDAYEFLSWLDHDAMQHIKQTLIKYIKTNL